MSRPADVLADGGQVGALMRAHDWSASPLGDPATWPQSLNDRRTSPAVPVPHVRGMGKGSRLSVHDSYAEILGTKHPGALGKRFLGEEDREVSALTRELLTSLGFAVVHVASAEAALGALA